MKKALLMLLLALIATSVIWADGTVRVFTGNGAWKYVLPPNPFEFPVCTYVQYNDASSPDNPWDRFIPPGASRNEGPPRPWEKLYWQDDLSDGYWIGRLPGFDVDTVTERWFLSPVFPLYSNISRGTIWLSADDLIDVALLRDVDHNATYTLPCVPVNGWANFYRFDLTEFLRGLDAKVDNCRMEFRLRNLNPYYSGMIAYMSYDYGEAREYTYNLSGSGWRYISMPFKPTNSAATLQSLFPGIIALARYFNWQTGSWTIINASLPLTGVLGDITRTYSFQIFYLTGGSHATTIEGYPIFEQRYLDITTNNHLYFGTINCDCEVPGQIGYVPFYGSNPDDLWTDKIMGDVGKAFESTGAIFYTPVWEIHPKRAYYAIPQEDCDSCTSPCLSFHLDLINYICSYPSLSFGEKRYSSSEEYIYERNEELAFFEFTEEDLALIRWIEDSVAPYIHVPDSNEMCERYPDLCERSERAGKLNITEIENSLSVSTYPSPFNSEIKIAVSLPNSGFVSVNVYSITGNLIKNLYSGETQSGVRTFNWNGLDDSGLKVPTGSYFAKVATETETKTMKILLLK